MFGEDTVRKLTDFGLSVNQAKVYLCIARQGQSTVSEISAATGLHRQDIYKILPKLEKKELITENLGKPVKINAIPLEDALSSLILLEQKKAKEKTNQLKAEMKELAKTVKHKQKETIKQDSSFVLITGDDAVTNRAIDTLTRVRKQHDAHLGDDLLFYHSEDQWRTWFQMDAKHGAKQRLLIGTLAKKDSVKKLIEKTRPPTGIFIVKSVDKKPYDNYMIMDHKEAFLNTQMAPCMIALWTNNKSIVRILEENFEKLWNDQRTETLYEQ